MPLFTATRIWTIIMALVVRLVVKYNPLMSNDCVGVSLGSPLYISIFMIHVEHTFLLVQMVALKTYLTGRRFVNVSSMVDYY